MCMGMSKPDFENIKESSKNQFENIAETEEKWNCWMHKMQCTATTAEHNNTDDNKNWITKYCSLSLCLPDNCFITCKQIFKTKIYTVSLKYLCDKW